MEDREKYIERQRQCGKGAMQDILFMALLRSAKDGEGFALPVGDEVIEFNIKRRKLEL